MKRHILILAACACACAWAGVMSARLGALGRNDSVVTNVTDVTPGNYDVVSNRAMSALQEHQSLWPAVSASTNYADGIAADFESGGRSVSNASYAGEASISWMILDDTDEPIDYSGLMTRFGAIVGTATNGLPEAISRKQDILPYPTNAIPFSAIDGAPSGGQVWNVASITNMMEYVTNGMANAVWHDDASIDAYMGSWPDGGAMFARVKVEGTYYLYEHIRLVGYGTWPTNDFQSVWWRSGTNIFVNVILEE